MRVLAIDTALSACAAALFDSEADEVITTAVLAMQRGHAEALMPLLVRLMDDAGMEFSEIDRVAVTVGPGSFTGLRVGIAAARGIALAAGKEAVGVSTLAAYAAPAIADDLADTVLAAVDARHEHVFLQMFGAGGRTLLPPSYAGVEQALDAARGVEGELHLAGSAASLLASRWPAGAPPPVLRRAGPAPAIEWVARLGAAADPGLAPAKPLYLRPVDARAQDAARLPRQ